MRESFLKVLMSFFILSLFSSLHAHGFDEEGKAKWEFGLGMGALVLPHYRGSNQETLLVSPVPYIRYHGKRLRVNREGARFYFYESDRVKVDISPAFALGVNSDDNDARTGMPDLKSIFEIGPRVQFTLYRSDDKNLRFRFSIPVRTATATDFQSTENIGWVIAPFLQLRYFTDGWESAIAAGPVWADNTYHDYFYKVSPEYATANRPAYEASSGYSGSRVTATLSKRFEKVFFGFFAKYDQLDNASFIDSPLIRQKNSFALGVVLSWVFKSSTQAAHAPIN